MNEYEENEKGYLNKKGGEEGTGKEEGVTVVVKSCFADFYLYILSICIFLF